MQDATIIRSARPDEHPEIGQLMVKVYSNLKNFLDPSKYPGYYNVLANIGELANKPGVEIIVAHHHDALAGAVVYFGDMQFYGSGGIATQEKNSSGFRFLAVDEATQGLGLGKLLTMECIGRAQEQGRKQVIIHTTKAMLNAWAMYERLGFTRSEDLDFQQGELAVFGFRYPLQIIR